MNKLEDWHCRGLIELRVTEAFHREQNSAGKQKGVQLHPIPEPMILGLEIGATNGWGGNCYLGNNYPSFQQVTAILFPDISHLTANQQNDVMHVLAAQAVDTEIFVTNDTAFVRDGRDERLRQIGLVVMNSTVAVQHLQARYGWD